MKISILGAGAWGSALAVSASRAPDAAHQVSLWARDVRQAQAMQARMQDMQAELERTLVEGQSGAGLVRVTLTAKGTMKGVTIDESLMKPEEREILEDLIVTAHEDAKRKGEALMEERMKSVTAGLPLPPGMKLPF